MDKTNLYCTKIATFRNNKGSDWFKTAFNFTMKMQGKQTSAAIPILILPQILRIYLKSRVQEKQKQNELFEISMLAACIRVFIPYAKIKKNRY